MERVLFWSNSELLIQICDRAPYIDIEARLENRYLKMLLEYSADSVFIACSGPFRSPISVQSDQ
jgi:hypothetical protein